MNVQQNQQAARAGTESELALPDDATIILPLRGVVVFPELVMPLNVGRSASVAAAQAAARAERPLGLLLQKDSATQQPGPDELCTMGTVAHILRYVVGDDQQHHLICQGRARFRVRSFLGGHEYPVARIETIDEPQAQEGDKEIDARVTNLRQTALQALRMHQQAPNDLINAVDSITAPGLLADTVAGYMDLEGPQKQQVLETIDLQARLDTVQSFLDYRVEVLQLSQQINQQTQQRMNERQREAMLREQMQSIRKELGEDEGRAEEVRQLEEAVEQAKLPEQADEQARRELKRLSRMPEGSSEYSMVRTYLDLLLELPWHARAEEKLEIEAARAILDTDHYGLDQVKRRILEHLAVHKLNPAGKSPILCFVGPPGVGKTSLGQSIARSMGRAFVRASLGGVHDEAEIRGHRRTYIGALPGNIIGGLRRAGQRNPVFMLDELDKLGASVHGDPAAALLEVLDPEQNDNFHDNYLAVDFDLSEVLFIGTANVLDQVPGPLRDRVEVIELPGYTPDDKVEIARKYLVGRQVQAAGLTPEQCRISDDALAAIVRDYTREAGLRNLEREIGRIARHVAVQVAEGEAGERNIDVADLHPILGARRYENEVALRTSVPGVATGLAWTPHGGDILFVEASRSPGTGRLILTGQLGEVMKESAQAALTLLKVRAEEFHLDSGGFDKTDIHVHIPAGAIPKDGPSAGTAVYTALASLLSGRTVRPDVAMTGEISLRGQVLPIGGIKEKALAAHQAGIQRVLFPRRNEKDAEEIPDSVRQALELRWISNVAEAVEYALAPESAAAAG
jgi:ATP-dependent Lon protease